MFENHLIFRISSARKMSAESGFIFIRRVCLIIKPYISVKMSFDTDSGQKAQDF